MVNSDEFIKRLEYLLEYYSLNASSFADKIRVQRSSISHLLSGRNKPSLDFIMKIIDVFPEVNLYWLLSGKDSFLKRGLEKDSMAFANESKYEEASATAKNDLQHELVHPKKTTDNSRDDDKIPSVFPADSFGLNSDDIYKIVIFYKDGTFCAFRPGN